MDFPDLSFYQWVLRGRGIKYVLAGKTGTECPKAARKAQRAEAAYSDILPEKTVSRKTTTSSKPAAASQGIPHQLIKYNRPAYFLCSYYDFPLDIEEGFTNPRCDLISRIFASLQWNERTYTFWPLSVLNNDTVAADADFFLKGIALIKPVYIILFGSRAFKAVFKDRDYTYGLHRYNEHQVIALPEFDSLMPDNRLLKQLVWEILRKYTPARF
ncbi:MAG: hypothetical protein ACLFN6_01540 [Desulfonatronovibrio sp.]